MSMTIPCRQPNIIWITFLLDNQRFYVSCFMHYPTTYVISDALAIFGLLTLIEQRDIALIIVWYWFWKCIVMMICTCDVLKKVDIR